MKNLLIVLTVVFSLTFSNNSFGQETVPKEVLLTTLNSVNDLDLSNLKTTQLMDYNKDYVDKVYDILESDKSEKDKKSAFESLGNDTEKDLIDLLGKSEYKKYAKLMSDQMKPLVKKSKSLKNLY